MSFKVYKVGGNIPVSDPLRLKHAGTSTRTKRGRPPSVDLVPAPQIRLPFDVFCTWRTWCMHSGKTLGPCRGSASGRSPNATLPRFCPRFRKALPRVTLNTEQCYSWRRWEEAGRSESGRSPAVGHEQRICPSDIQKRNSTRRSRDPEPS